MNALNSYAASTPAVDKDHVFVIWPTANELGVITLDHDGNEKWRKTFGPVYGKHGPCVSPICVEDRLYCMNTDGDVVVLRTADQYELLSVNPLGEKTQATPAVAGGILYLRTLTKVIAVGPSKD